MKTLATIFIGFTLLLAGMTTTFGQATKFLYSDTVYFDFAKYELRAADSAALQKAVKAGTKLPQVSILLDAHTDAIGEDAANLVLSNHRAEAVKDYLTRSGVDSAKIKFEFKGEQKPIADNETERGRQLNRRVVISVFKGNPVHSGPNNFTITVIDKVNREPVVATIKAVISPDELDLETDELGKVKIPVMLSSRQKKMEILVTAVGYGYHNQTVELKPNGKLLVELVPFQAGQKIELQNLYFYGNQAVLRSGSESALRQALEMLELNDNVTVEIAGHINKPGVPPDRLERMDRELAVNRAKFVYDYLIEKGIEKSRLTYKGYGNSEMVFPRARTYSEMSRNMRVEFKVLKVD